MVEESTLISWHLAVQSQAYHGLAHPRGPDELLRLHTVCSLPLSYTAALSDSALSLSDGNYPPVRIAAFDALLLLNPLNDEWPLVKYLFSVLREDSSLLVQRRLAEAILQSLPVLAAIHDLAAPEMVFEEEGVTRKGGNDPLFNTLKWLRKNPGRSLNFRQCMLQTMM